MTLFPPRRFPRLPRGLTLLPLALSCTFSGCYAYRAADPGALTVGADVRLQLTADGAASLMDAAGLRLRTVEGRLQGLRADGALVVLPSDVTTTDGDPLKWRRGALAVPAQALDGSQQRTISRRRSVAVAASIAGVFTSVVLYSFRSIRGGGGNTVSPGPGTPE